jgi:hypothetical protein
VLAMANETLRALSDEGAGRTCLRRRRRRVSWPKVMLYGSRARSRFPEGI